MNDIADDEIWRYIGVFTPKDVKRMLDVEFISELTIAAIHGVQNKKLTLDKYYELYEDEFPERAETKFAFDIVNRELLNILPNINKTRWSKKTDFYTLFVLFANRKHLLPLSEGKRKLASDLLLDIASQIDQLVSTDKENGNVEGVNELIKQYGQNLRASSDLGARKKREEALEILLEPAFKI